MSTYEKIMLAISAGSRVGCYYLPRVLRIEDRKKSRNHAVSETSIT